MWMLAWRAHWICCYRWFLDFHRCPALSYCVVAANQVKRALRLTLTFPRCGASDDAHANCDACACGVSACPCGGLDRRGGTNLYVRAPCCSAYAHDPHETHGTHGRPVLSEISTLIGAFAGGDPPSAPYCHLCADVSYRALSRHPGARLSCNHSRRPSSSSSSSSPRCCNCRCLLCLCFRLGLRAPCDPARRHSGRPTRPAHRSARLLGSDLPPS